MFQVYKKAKLRASLTARLELAEMRLQMLKIMQQMAEWRKQVKKTLTEKDKEQLQSLLVNAQVQARKRRQKDWRNLLRILDEALEILAPTPPHECRFTLAYDGGEDVSFICRSLSCTNKIPTTWDEIDAMYNAMRALGPDPENAARRLRWVAAGNGVAPGSIMGMLFAEAADALDR